MGDLIKEFWGIILAGVGAIVWLARLEGRSLSNEKEIRRLWNQRKEDLERAEASRRAQSETLAEMRGDMKEIRGDIKKLLSRPQYGPGA